MPWIATYLQPLDVWRGGYRYKRLRIVSCDRCGHLFVRDFKKSHFERVAYEYCSHSCARKHVLADHPDKWRLAADAGREKGLAKLRITAKTPEYRAARSKLATELWQDPEIRAKRVEACQVSHNTPEYKTKIAAIVSAARTADDGTWNANIGAARRTPESRAKSSAALKAARAADDGTWTKNSTSNEAVQKRYASMRKNGTHRESKPEKEMVAFLKSRFGCEDIVKHPPPLLGRRQIDCWIQSLDTYVEFDGMYWHGLDRPYEELSSARRKTFDGDRRLDAHCLEHGIRLVRMREDIWKAMSYEEKLAWADSL